MLRQFYARTSEVIREIPDYDFEFVFVNDGSRDGTLAIMRELRAKDARVSYVNLSRNFGKEIAMIAGIDYLQGDAAVIIDADLQEPPELIPEMIHGGNRAMMIFVPNAAVVRESHFSRNGHRIRFIVFCSI